MRPHEAKQFPYGRWFDRPTHRAPRTHDPDPPVPYKTGDNCDTNVNVPQDPLCRTFVPICGMRRVGAILRTTNGQTNGTVVVVPNKNTHFLPRAVRMEVRDSANPEIGNPDRFVLISGVSINDFPQESIHTPAPTAATTAVYSSEDYAAPDNYGVPIPWGIISNAANLLTLNVHFFNDFAAGTNVDVIVGIWGHPLSDIPKGYELGFAISEQMKDAYTRMYAR